VGQQLEQTQLSLDAARSAVEECCCWCHRQTPLPGMSYCSSLCERRRMMFDALAALHGPVTDTAVYAAEVARHELLCEVQAP
jgi:hypothetical protein